MPLCGNPTFSNDAVRLQNIPDGFSGAVRPEATCSHRKRGRLRPVFWFSGRSKETRAQGKEERLLIPVGKKLATHNVYECPPIIRQTTTTTTTTSY